MQLVNTNNFKRYYSFLLAILSAGVFFITLSGYFSINSMKNSFDELYLGSLVPLSELNEISYLYSNTLRSTIDKARSKTLPQQEVLQHLYSQRDSLAKHLEQYSSHTNMEENELFNATTLHEVENSLIYLNKVIAIYENEHYFSNSTTYKLYHHFTQMQKIIESQIHEEMQLAKNQRHKHTTIYNSSISTILAVILLIIFAIAIVSYSLFRCVKKFIFHIDSSNNKLICATNTISNLSMKDEVTDLCNQRQFCMLFDRELQKSRRNQSIVSLLLVKIDYFKEYQELYGKIAAKKLLKQIATLLQDRLNRPGDYIFKFENEMFSILVTDANENIAKHFTHQLVEEISNLNIVHRTSRFEKITISIGVVTTQRDEEVKDSLLLSKADTNLNLAINRGANQVISTYY